MMSYGFGGAVVNKSVLFRQRHVGGACRPGLMGAPPPGLQDAVAEDGQQGQDGYRQQNGQRDVTWGGSSESIS